MGTITIRNLDDDAIRELKNRASANHRSLEAELRHILETAAKVPDRQAFIDAARRIRAMTPAVPQDDSAALIRADRDSDHGRGP